MSITEWNGIKSAEEYQYWIDARVRQILTDITGEFGSSGPITFMQLGGIGSGSLVSVHLGCPANKTGMEKGSEGVTKNVGELFASFSGATWRPSLISNCSKSGCHPFYGRNGGQYLGSGRMNEVTSGELAAGCLEFYFYPAGEIILSEEILYLASYTCMGDETVVTGANLVLRDVKTGPMEKRTIQFSYQGQKQEKPIIEST
jgi:hypothetical protein